MAESDWDTVTVLRKKGPTAAQAKSKQVSENVFYNFSPFEEDVLARMLILGLVWLSCY